MDRECRILARRIFTMAMLISEKTKADCFVDYQAHVGGIDVRMYPNGWEQGAKPVNLLESYRCDKETMRVVYDYLEEFMSNAEWEDVK